MLLFGRNFAPHRPWAILVLLGSLLATGWWGFEAWRSVRPPGGSSTPGMTLGEAAGAIILFEMLLWPRKRLRAWRIGSAQALASALIFGWAYSAFHWRRSTADLS